jgi:hypothetical protein
MASLLVYVLKGFDSDGIDMHLSVAHKTSTIANSKYLGRFLNESTFTGQCNMAYCLGQIFETYKAKITSNAKRLKPINIYILTNAVWQPKCEVDVLIIDFVKFLMDKDQWLRQVGIQFIRFGDSEASKVCLETLDTLKQRGLTERYLPHPLKRIGAHEIMTDGVNYIGISLIKSIIEAIFSRYS